MEKQEPAAGPEKMKKREPAAGAENFSKKTRARRRDNDEQISNAKPEAAKCAPRRPEAFLGRLRGPHRSFGEPRKKIARARAHKICSRIRAGNAVGPPTTSKLYDLLVVSPKTKFRLGKTAPSQISLPDLGRKRRLPTCHYLSLLILSGVPQIEVSFGEKN